MAFKQHTISINGANISYQRGGAGPTLLYLHGAGGTGNAMPLMNALASQYDVVIPDHPGFGASDDPDWLDTIHDTAYCYLDFLQQLDLTDIIVFGSSLGGWMAMEIAIRDQSRIKRLILSNAAGLSLADIAMGDVFLWGDEAKVRNMIFDKSLQDKVLSAVVTEEQQALANKNFFTTAKLSWEPRFCNPNLDKWIYRITVPTLIVWGDHDKLFPEAYGQNLKEKIPHAKYVVIKDCGHLPHVEKRDEIEKEICQFIHEVA
ncbi:MAG: pimeloyl-ACP methyl ester carboxylesterase [Oceanicoccus sp.]|jgi:pimeloyl-ACP methyl ester carboxylesterase